MATDPGISLQAQAPQIDLASIYGAAMQLRQMQQDQQFNNSLKAVLQQPDAIDPKTGAPSTNTLATIARMGPKGLEISAKLSDEASLAQQRTAQTKHDQAEATIDDLKGAHEALTSGVDLYDSELASGHVDPSIAEDNLKTSLHDFIYKQPWSKDRQDKNWQALSALDPAGLRKAASQLGQTVEERQRQQSLTEERTPATMNGKPVSVDKEGNVYDPNSGAKLPVTAPIIKQEPGFNPQAADARAEATKPTLENDPVTGKQYWAFPPTKDKGPHYETLDGEPYEPQGAAHIQSGQVRGGIAGAITAAQEANQAAGKGPLSVDQIEQIASDYGRKTKAAAAFGTGKQGDQVRFLNVAMDHLATLKDAALALKNGDIKRFNALSQQIAEETGSPIPTNFDAIRQIVSQEVHKGVAGVGGSAEERDNLSQNVSRSASPDQLIGSITSVDKLLAGQADGLRRQYEQSTGLDNFDDMLSPSAKGLLKDRPDEGVPRGAPPPAPPHEKTATGPNGQKIVLRSGQWVDMQTGKPL